MESSVTSAGRRYATRRNGHILVGPQDDPGFVELVTAAVNRAGGTDVDDMALADGVVWLGKDPALLLEQLGPQVRWVQLPDAGVETWIRAGILDRRRVVTCARAAYAPQVAEHAVTLVLACARRLAECARATVWPAGNRTWGGTLRDAQITVIGAGAIGSETIRLLAPFGPQLSAVTRSGQPVELAHRSLPATGLHEAIAGAAFVVVTAASTQATRAMLSRREFASMRNDAWLVNVARGDLVDTEALVEALNEEAIAGAALDVLDPEPLPDGHPLWTHPKVLITPHTANPPRLRQQAYAERVAENTARFIAGQELIAMVDGELGY